MKAALPGNRGPGQRPDGYLVEDVLAMSQQPPSGTRVRGPLAEALVQLAGTPDDMPTIDAQLKKLAQLAPDQVACVDYASVTALRDDTYVTVAANSDLALAVDQAQYADNDARACSRMT